MAVNFGLKLLGVTLSLDLTFQPLWVLAADGGVASTAANTATQVTQAPNSVEVINIADPNAAGVSHNLFKDYQVGPQGQVLNNSTSEVRSKLAGTIEGNSQLQHGPARIILNEVTGVNPSSLLGVTEVAGQAASLVIANPNGITCSGCGFLNTPRVTLGTGRPLWQEGQLTGLSVDKGLLEIGPDGLQGGNLEQLELLAKQIVLYGQVVSPDLTLAAGSLKFNFADGNVEQRGVLPGSVLPYLAIDASALGAMYANQIALVATDSGVGVNVEGPMAAYTGSIRIDANGEVRVSDAQAQQNLTIATQGKVTVDKALANSVDINTADSVQLNVSLAAQEQLNVQAKSIQNLGSVSAGYRPDGSLDSQASLSLITTAKADNQGQWLSAGSLAIEAADLTNRAGAMISGREGLSLIAGAGSNRGELNSLGALTLTIDGLWDNQDGRVQTAGQLTLNAGSWNNSRGHTQAADLSTQIESSLNNTQGEVVTTQGNLIVDAAELINQQGVLQSQNTVTVTASNLDNTQGSVTARGGETSKLTLDGALTNRGGTVAIASNQTNLQAKTLDQTAKSAGLAGGTLEFTGAADITAEQINNTGGKIVGSGTSLTLKAQDLNNQNGTVRSGPALTKTPETSTASTTPAANSSQLTLVLSGELNNQQGRVLSDNLNLSAATLDNRTGYIDAQSTQGTTQINISGDVQNQGGTVFSKQNTLNLQAANWQNAQGQIGHLASGVFTLNTQQMDNTAGKVQTFGSAQWQLSGWNNTQGVASVRGDGDASSTFTLSEDWINEQGRLLVGGKDFTLNARTVHNNGQNETQGIWHSGSGAWALTAETLINTAGKLGSDGDLKLTLNHLENAGELQAHQLTLKANSATNSGGITLFGTAANSLDAQVQGDWFNQNGKLTLAGGGLITANRWDNSNGQLLAVGAVNLAAKGGDADQASFLNKNGWLQADGGLTLATFSALDNAQGKLLAGGDTVLSSQGGINNTGGTIDLTPVATNEAPTPSLTISAQGVLDNTQGILQSFSQGQHTLSAKYINNTQGLIFSDAQNLTANAGTVDNTAGRWQHSGQTLAVNGLDEWINKANSDTAALLHTDGNLVIQGFNRLLNDGQVGEAPSTIRARSAQLQGKKVENLNGAQLALVATEKPATQTSDNDALTSPQAFASLPPVESSLQLDQLVNQGRIFTQASLNLSDAHLLNTGGEFSSFSDLTLTAGDLASLGGKLWADGVLTLASEGDFTFANQAQLDAGKGVVWDVKGAFTNQGTLASGANVTLKANTFTNAVDADLSALGTLALEITQAVTNQGRIRGLSDTHVQANSLENNGLISAKQALTVTAGTSITNTNTLFATGDLTALAQEVFNTNTPTTTASIWAGGKLVLAGGKAGQAPQVGKQLINTSGSIQTYKEGDIELWFKQITNQTASFELNPEPIQVKQWFTTGSGKSADAIQDGEFDLTISELMGLMSRSGNQVPYAEHNLYVFQPSEVVRQPRINSGGALLIQTLNDPKSAQGECSAPCEPALIRNEGGSISAVGDLKIEAGYVSGANVEPGVGSRVDNANLFLPGETTKDSSQFINVIPDPGVVYTDIARFSNMGTLSVHFGQDAPRAVEKVATLHTGTIIAGGELTAHVEKVENGEKATYQAKWTGPAINDDAPPPMDFSQGAPFSRVALTNAVTQQANSTERTQLDPALANPDALGSSLNSDITPPAQPQIDPTQAREARIYNPLQNLVLPNNSYLYAVDIKGSSPYVVQAGDLIKPPTDKPGETPISSDYFFTQLGYDPEQIGRRLGDSFYETELVRQAIINTRGVRFVTDPRTGLAIDSDEAQYRYLLDNALEAQKDLQLAVGTALTPEQVRALTQDIVWLERHELAGQEVWVPVYYASGVDPDQMAGGAIMAGQSVRVVSEELLNKGDIRGLSLVDVSSQTSQNFGAIGSLDRLIVNSQNLDNKGLMVGKTTQVSGFDIDNSGQMIARETLNVTADNALNNRGELAGTDVNAKSSGDLISQGRINASNNVDLDAARDMLLKPGQGAAINAGGKLKATSGRDLAIEGQTINTQGDATFSATRDLAITPSTEQIITSTGTTTTQETRNTATKITTAGSLSIDAGRDIAISATKIQAGQNVSLAAERDLNITSTQDRTHTEGQGKNWHSIETDVQQVTTDINAGGSIDATAGQDINLTAVKGEAGGDIHLNAARDTNLLGAVDSEYDYNYRKTDKSFGRSKTTESESLAETAVATELSASGNLLLNTKLGSQGEILKETGQRINAEGAQLSAGDSSEIPGKNQGTITAYAADGITLAGQTTKSLDYSETRRSGTLGLSKKAKGSNTGEDHSSATTLSSTGDTQLLSDHNLSLEGVVADVDGDMTLSAVDDLRVTPGETHTQTQSWNNKSGAFSGGSLYRKTEVNNEDGTTDLTDSALLVGGNLRVEAGSTEILGTRIQTGSKGSTGNFTATVDSGNLTLGAAQASSFHKDSKLDIRVNGTDAMKGIKQPHKMVENENGRAKISLGKATYLNADNSSSDLVNRGSQVDSYGDITLDAKSAVGKTQVAGSALSAAGNIDLHGGQGVALTSVDNTHSERQKTQEGTGEMSVVVQHQAVEVAKAAQNLLDAREQLSDAKRQLSQYENNLDTQQSQLNQLRAELAAGTPGVAAEDIQLLSEIVRDLEDDRAWYQTGVALASVNLASATTALAQQAAAAAASSTTWGFNAGVQFDLSGSENQSESFNSTSIGSSLNADSIKLSTGSKNSDGSYNTQGTQVDMQGAQLAARDIQIETGTLNARSREDTQRQSSQSKSGQLSAQVTVYGAAGGASVNGSFQRAEAESQSTTVHNTQIQADTLNITTSGDTNLAGATVRAEEKLTLTVGGNLNLESQQNRSSSKSHEQGMSAGISLGGASDSNENTNYKAPTSVGSANGTNAGVSQGNSRSRTQQTVVTSLTSGGSAQITVKGNTHLGGAVMGTFEAKDGCADNKNPSCEKELILGRDLNQLSFTTGSLTFNNLLNINTSTSSNLSLSSNLNLGTGDHDKNTQGPVNPRLNQNTAKTSKGDDLGPTSSAISLGNSNHNSANKTLSTLGHGTITVGGVDLEQNGQLTLAATAALQGCDTTANPGCATAAPLKGLNRDIEHTQKSLWDSTQSMQVSSNIDHRMLNEDGRAEIKQQVKDLPENIQKTAQNVPAPEGGNLLENAVGKTLNKLSEWTRGIVPSDNSHGGLIAQLPILLGADDIKARAVQIRRADDPYVLAHPELFMDATKMPYVETLEEPGRQKLEGLVVNLDGIQIALENSTYQNHFNGILNNIPQALVNGMEQTDSKTVTEFYNPTHGLLGDLLESTVDKFSPAAFIHTGIARQTGEYIKDVTLVRGGYMSTNFVAHSQGTLLVNAGLNLLDEQDFSQGKLKRETVPTFFINGAAVRAETFQNSVEGLGFTMSGSNANEDDFVAEFLGRNEGTFIPKLGIGSVDPMPFWESLGSIVNAPKTLDDKYPIKDPITGDQENKTSPHSTYGCLINCGDEPPVNLLYIENLFEMSLSENNENRNEENSR